MPLLANGLLSFLKNMWTGRRNVAGGLAETIREQAWPILGLIAFVVAKILWNQIHHLSVPVNFGCLAFSTEMAAFYEVVWTIAFLPLVPALLVGALSEHP